MKNPNLLLGFFPYLRLPIWLKKAPVTVMQMGDNEKKPKKAMSGPMPPYNTIQFRQSSMTFNRAVQASMLKTS